MGREEPKKAQESFRHDPEVQVLIATARGGRRRRLQSATFAVTESPAASSFGQHVFCWGIASIGCLL
jgi:hypothetical protein